MTRYPKRLIEVDLPIKRISAHSRREKSIRHGHISTLHIWWARRPLAACRAVVCAALWPDPADELCPDAFREVARAQMLQWATKHLHLCGEESYRRFVAIQKSVGAHGRAPGAVQDGPLAPAIAPHGHDPSASDGCQSSVGAHGRAPLRDNLVLRQALLDFIADFANWDNSTVKEYLKTSRALTQSAHEALGGAPGTRPLVVDPFVGGGSIPLEALRVGADTFASDLNPVPVLLNKVVLEYIPKYGQRLADEVRKWGEWIKREAEKELAEFYPKDPDGATPIAYLWARTIQCEGPSCGAEVPLIRSLWLAKKANRSVALQLVPRPRAKRVDLQIIVKQRGGWVYQDDPKTKLADPKFDGTVKRGSATCACCGYTTPVARVREQLKQRRGGTDDARLMCIVTTRADEQSRAFRHPTKDDLAALKHATERLAKSRVSNRGKLSLVPEETLPVMSGVFNAPLYGHNTWGSLFTPRQLLGLTTLARLAREVRKRMPANSPEGLNQAVQLVLALGVSRVADISNALCTWKASMVQAIHLFTRQAIPMMWDFTETALFSEAAGDYGTTIGNMVRILEGEAGAFASGNIERCSATNHPMPDDSGDAFITDPPYYNAVPYADLSDFFYVWLKRMLSETFPDLFATELSPKEDEACQMSGWDPVRYAHKDSKW